MIFTRHGGEEKMPKIKYNKKEFETKVKELAKLHDLPEKVIRQWLKESYNMVEKQYRDNVKKAAKEALDQEKKAKE